MNSIKNMVVVVLLLGVSYGAFQVINAPDPTFDDGTEALDIQIGAAVDSAEISLESPIAPPANSPGEEANDVPPLVMAPPLQPKMPPVPETVPEIESGSNSVEIAPPTRPSQPLTPSPSGQELAEGSTFNAQPQTPLEGITPPPSRSDNTAIETPVPPASENLAEKRDSVSPVQPPAIEISPPQFDAVPNFDRTADAKLKFSDELFDKPIQWQQIEQLVADGQFKQALMELSRSYNGQHTAEQRKRMTDWLDALAGKVIYSTEHHLEPRPYIVKNGDTLEMLAAQWQVPPQLIRNVNRAKIQDPDNLGTGTELKQVKGPFQAQLNIERNELTVFLNGLYAGRFAVQLESDQSIDHGMYSYENAKNRIRLSQHDANDVNGILSDQSPVKIMR